jgi:hypothetical protein
LSFFQEAAWSSRGAEAMVRNSFSFGMSPAPIWSRIAGWTLASSRSLRIWRRGTASASAIASSVQFSEANLSIARQRSTVAIGARATFSTTLRIGS